LLNVSNGEFSQFQKRVEEFRVEQKEGMTRLSIDHKEGMKRLGDEQKEGMARLLAEINGLKK